MDASARPGDGYGGAASGLSHFEARDLLEIAIGGAQGEAVLDRQRGQVSIGHETARYKWLAQPPAEHVGVA